MGFAENFPTILIFFFISLDIASSSASWSYKNAKNWGEEYPQCNGKRQSPINLRYREALPDSVAPITFINYDAPLKSSMKIVNNGHTANLVLMPVDNEKRPQIEGALLPGQFEAMSLHFHWGSENSKGSEHTINGQRSDAEMHIVHKNTKYSSLNEALKHQDGLAVLGVMIAKIYRPKKTNFGLFKILKNVPEIREPNSEVSIGRRTNLTEILGDLVKKEFFTYKGSLTTPPCSEAVTWIVFPNEIQVKTSLINNLFQLKDNNGDPLINTYRPLQNKNRRKIFYRDDDPKK